MHWLSLTPQLRTFKVMRNETNSSLCVCVCLYVHIFLCHGTLIPQTSSMSSPDTTWLRQADEIKSNYLHPQNDQVCESPDTDSAAPQSSGQEGFDPEFSHKKEAETVWEKWVLMHLGKQARKCMRIFKLLLKMQQLQIEWAAWIKLRGLQVVWWHSRLVRRDNAWEGWAGVAVRLIRSSSTECHFTQWVWLEVLYLYPFTGECSMYYQVYLKGSYYALLWSLDLVSGVY